MITFQTQQIKNAFFSSDCLLLPFETTTNSLGNHAEIYFLYDFVEEKGHNISKINIKPGADSLTLNTNKYENILMFHLSNNSFTVSAGFFFVLLRFLA